MVSLLNLFRIQKYGYGDQQHTQRQTLVQKNFQSKNYIPIQNIFAVNEQESKQIFKEN